jgi:hypothetical protein
MRLKAAQTKMSRPVVAATQTTVLEPQCSAPIEITPQGNYLSREHDQERRQARPIRPSPHESTARSK